ncbi:energy-coupling factor ABC transporter permease [Oleiphilus sp. HI0123]|nr:energy-coupling factor ABC transporter permease [Oleiphilus sp. HI0123]
MAHIPIMILEGFVTGAAVLLIRQVKPELLRISEDWDDT